MSEERDEYNRFARWLLSADQRRFTPERFDHFVLFEVWKAGVASERDRDIVSETGD